MRNILNATNQILKIFLKKAYQIKKNLEEAPLNLGCCSESDSSMQSSIANVSKLSPCPIKNPIRNPVMGFKNIKPIDADKNEQSDVGNSQTDLTLRFI
jgi:hypothetical protein